MIVTIGSKNNVKINAVKEVIVGYEIFSNVRITSVDAKSEVSDQPMSMDEAIKGAMNRARNAFKDCKYSFGIEDGLMKVPNTKTNFMNICVCAIYDGKEFHLGLSSCFEYPKEITRLAVEEGLNLSEAFKKTGLTNKPYVGYEEGGVGILTKGRLVRKDYTKQAVMMAMVHLENPELYK